MFILIGIPLFQSFNPTFPLRLNSKPPPPPPPPPQHTFQFAEFHPEKSSLHVIKSSLILKVAKNFRETFFRGVELIRVEVM